METVMNAWIRIGLLTIALVAWAAGGYALAVIRARRLHDGRNDQGMISVCVALLGVGALTSAAASGFAGIFAFGGVCVWASYIAAAQRLGMFRLQAPRFEEAAFEEPRPRA